MLFRNSAQIVPSLEIKHEFSELKRDSLYNLSVALTASAKLKSLDEYKKNLKDINISLSKSEDDSRKTWMLGRVALAASQMDDEKTVADTLIQLKKLLPNVKKDACYAWALGYMAAINTNEYKENKEKMLEAVKFLTKAADVLWAHVMNLQAAAKEGDQDCFNEILVQMKKYTKKETIAEALSTIPQDDWQAWALGIVLKAAATIRKKELYDELLEPSRLAITDAIKVNSMANALLAELDADLAVSLIEKRPTSKVY